MLNLGYATIRPLFTICIEFSNWWKGGTPHGLELLSTVHWVCKHEQAADLQSVLAKTYAWNDRKKKFTSRQIELAHNTLQSAGWLT